MSREAGQAYSPTLLDRVPFDCELVREETFGPAEANCAVLRDDNFKYVHFNGGLEPLLYDMKADPNEGDNLASDPTHLPVLLKFVQRMINHRMTFAHHATSRMKLTENGVRIG